MSETEISKAAKTLSKLGSSKGGLARAQSMSPQKRQEIATKAANVRWGVPRATHVGEIHIGDTSIPCAVLEDGTRLLTQEGFLKAIGRSGKPAAGRGSSVEKIAPFLALENLKPFINEGSAGSTFPVIFQTVTGSKAYGYKAELLPKVCEVYLQARDANMLRRDQLRFARACDILMRGLAHVGIVALIDEATGYQDIRNRDELHKILAAYISAELLPWAKRFPDEFYKQICRLNGWPWNPFNPAGGPRIIGKITNQLVYDKLPDGVLDELRRKNPVVYNNGRRKYKNFQFLTDNIGNPHLEKQVSTVTTLMRISPNKRVFDIIFDKAFPSSNKQIEMALDEEEEIWSSLEEHTE